MKKHFFGWMKNKKMKSRFVILSAGLLMAAIFTGSSIRLKETSDIQSNTNTQQSDESGHDYYRVIADSNNKKQLYVRYSKDQGQNWASYPLPICSYLSDYEFTFLDDSEGYLIIYGDAGAGTLDKALYHTMDGGATWTLQATNSPQDNTIGTMYYSHLSGISYGKDGLVIASEAFRGTGIDFDPVISWSHDYGVTWEEFTIELPRELIIEHYNLSVEEDSICGQGLDAYVDGTKIVIPIKIILPNDSKYVHYILGDEGGEFEFVD